MGCIACGEETEVFETVIGDCCEVCFDLDRAEREGITYEELEQERAERNSRDAYCGETK